MLNAHTLKKLRDMGLIEVAADGSDGVRVSIQCRDDLTGRALTERRNALQTWLHAVESTLSRFGGTVDPDSLSVTAQTVEAVIPVAACESVQAELLKSGERLDVIMEHQVV